MEGALPFERSPVRKPASSRFPMARLTLLTLKPVAAAIVSMLGRMFLPSLSPKSSKRHSDQAGIG